VCGDFPIAVDVSGTAALFGGADGLSVIKPMVNNIARWLRIGGAVGVEHDDTNGAQVAELFRSRRVFDHVVEHPDLAQRVQKLREGCERINQEIIERAQATDRLVRKYPYSFISGAVLLGMLVGAKLGSRK